MNELSYFSVSRGGDRSKSRDDDPSKLSRDISELQKEFDSKLTNKKSNKSVSRRKTPNNPYTDQRLKDKRLEIPKLKATPEIRNSRLNFQTHDIKTDEIDAESIDSEQRNYIKNHGALDTKKLYAQTTKK